MSEFVEPKHTLLSTVHSQVTTDTIASKVSSIVGTNEELKTDLELVKYVCNQVENIVTNKDVDKSLIVINVMMKIFPTITVFEQIFIKKAITFLHNNNHVKKVSMSKFLRISASNFIKKKFL